MAVLEVPKEALPILQRVRPIDFYICVASGHLTNVGWYLLAEKKTVQFSIHDCRIFVSGVAVANGFDEALALVHDRGKLEELGLTPPEDQRRWLRARHRNKQRSRARARKRAANAERLVNNRPDGIPAAALEPAFVAREPAAGAAADPMDVIRDMLGPRFGVRR